MSKCAIWNCESTVGRKSRYYSYGFPRPEKSPDRFASWIKHTNPRYKHNKDSQVCGIHFKLEDFDESDMLKIRLTPNLFKNLRPKLKKGVVPTLNLDGWEGTKDGVLFTSSYVKVKDVQEILNGGPNGDRASTSGMLPGDEVKVVEEECPGTMSRHSVGVQCEFGTEVFRRRYDAESKTVDK